MMGHFTLEIPGFGHADVRHGSVRKKRISLFARRSDRPKRIAGYIVTLTKSANDKEICELFRLPDGKWSTDPDGIGSLDF